MTIKRVQNAAYIRGMFFDGEKKYRNSFVGYAYEIYTGRGFFQADTLNAIYKEVMKHEKVQ